MTHSHIIKSTSLIYTAQVSGAHYTAWPQRLIDMNESRLIMQLYITDCVCVDAAVNAWVSRCFRHNHVIFSSDALEDFSKSELWDKVTITTSQIWRNSLKYELKSQNYDIKSNNYDTSQNNDSHNYEINWGYDTKS